MQKNVVTTVVVCAAIVGMLTDRAWGVFSRIELEQRPTVSLNGLWQVQTVVWGQEDAFDPNTPAEIIRFPQYGMGAGPDGVGADLMKRNTGCYRLAKTVDVPADWQGKHVFLVFRQARFAVDAFVNGQKAGAFAGISSPVSMNVTKQVRPGESNTVNVHLYDWRAAIASGSSYKPGPSYGYHDKPAGSILWPINMHFADGGIGIHDDMYFIAVEPVYVEDIFVKTSVRKNTIDVEVTLENLTDAPRQTTLRAGVYERDGGARVFAFEPRPVKLEAAGPKTVTLSRPWKSARLWQPFDPHLYEFRAELVEDDRVLDTKHRRFGFREVWTDGAKLMLNGYPVKLFQLGTFMTAAQWYDSDTAKCREKIKAFYQGDVLNAGLNCVRWSGGVLPDVYIDVADEMGVFITIEPDTTHCFGADFLSDVFWQRVYANVEGFARLYRSNPSILVYAGGNEILISAYHNKDNELDYAYGKYFEIQNVLHRVDPTRPVMFEGDGAMRGQNVDIYNNHAYEAEEAREWPIYSFVESRRLNVEYHANPVTDFWGGKKIEYDRVPWTGDKPMILGEMFSMYKMPVENFSYIGGEDIYRGLFENLDGYFGVAADLLVNIVAGYRHRDVSGFCPWYLFPLNRQRPDMLEAQRRAYKLNCFYVYDRFNRYFTGQKSVKRVVCFNDGYDANAAEIALEWVIVKAGTSERRGVQKLGAVKPGASPKIGLEFTAPSKPGDYTLTIRMFRNGQNVHEETVPLKVRPDLSKVKAKMNGRRVACYDPAGGTAPILKGILDSVQTLKTPVPDKHDVLILGERSYDPACESASKQLLRWVSEGGRLLVLGQDYVVAPFNLDFSVDKGDTYTAFIRSKDHAVFGGMENDDVRTWADEFIVGYNSFRKFSKTSFRSLADSGYGHEGLVFSVLTEQTLGKGAILYCQFRIADRYQKEPAAQKLLKNMIEYLCVLPEPASYTLSVVSADARKIEMIRSHGVTVRDTLTMQAGDVDGNVLWLDGADDAATVWLMENGDTLASFVKRGGVVFVDQAGTKVVEGVNACFGRNFALSESMLRIGHLQYGDGETEKLLWGLSLFDVTWDSYQPPFYTEKIVDYTILPASCGDDVTVLLTEPLRIGSRRNSWCKYMAIGVNAADNQPNPHPGHAMIGFPYGDGRVYVSLLAMDRGYFGKEQKKADRLIGAMLNNLDVGMDLNKIKFTMEFSVGRDNFVPVGKAISGRGYSGRFIKCSAADRVKWQIPALRERNYHISFRIATGITSPSFVPWKTYVDGNQVPLEKQVTNIKSELKGDTWEFFGADLAVAEMIRLNEHSVIEIESEGDHLLVFGLSLEPQQELKY